MSDPQPKRRDQPLAVVVRDGLLTISIGVDTLVCCAENGPEWPHLKVVAGKADQFAEDVALRLRSDEDETGLTPLMKTIDAAIAAVADDSPDSIDWTEDIEDALEKSEVKP